MPCRFFSGGSGSICILKKILNKRDSLIKEKESENSAFTIPIIEYIIFNNFNWIIGMLTLGLMSALMFRGYVLWQMKYIRIDGYRVGFFNSTTKLLIQWFLMLAAHIFLLILMLLVFSFFSSVSLTDFILPLIIDLPARKSFYFICCFVLLSYIISCVVLSYRWLTEGSYVIGKPRGHSVLTVSVIKIAIQIWILFFCSIATLGLAYPFALNRFYKWLCRYTMISSYRLGFKEQDDHFVRHYLVFYLGVLFFIMLALTLYFNKSFDFMTPSIKVTAALIILGVFNILIYASCIIKKKLIGGAQL
jgi:hypothetical protein